MPLLHRFNLFLLKWGFTASFFEVLFELVHQSLLHSAHHGVLLLRVLDLSLHLREGFIVFSFEFGNLLLVRLLESFDALLPSRCFFRASTCYLLCRLEHWLLSLIVELCLELLDLTSELWDELFFAGLSLLLGCLLFCFLDGSCWVFQLSRELKYDAIFLLNLLENSLAQLFPFEMDAFSQLRILLLQLSHMTLKTT